MSLDEIFGCKNCGKLPYLHPQYSRIVEPIPGACLDYAPPSEKADRILGEVFRES